MTHPYLPVAFDTIPIQQSMYLGKRLNFWTQQNVSLSKWNFPKDLRSPKVAINETNCLLDVYSTSLKHSQIGILNMKLGWGPWRPGIQRLSWWQFQGATIQITANAQYCDIFMTRNLCVWTWNKPKVHERRVHIWNKDDFRDRLCLRGKDLPIKFVLGNVTNTDQTAILSMHTWFAVDFTNSFWNLRKTH